ncbi:GAF domain-containing hybrid sensor histidine kinase/response regulator [Nitrincola sp. MINF-07-Sa-05]|uniref:GAF domain-containing hybrid sensor histidine kinase/response regulator n=1 Tax=Nitrincola salilacus TaxID=3400273 RepID=UPI0039180DAF
MIQSHADSQAVQVYDFESKILEQITTGASLTTVLESIIQAIETLAHPAIASIVFLDETGQHLRHGIAPHLPEEYNDAIDGLEIGPNEGSCGAALSRGEQVIVNDINTDPLWTKYRQIALQYGLRACWSTPVKDTKNRVLASFALYYKEPRTPTHDDLQLIERFTHLVAIAIERIRSNNSLQQSQERLQERLKELKCLYQVLNLTADQRRSVSDICSDLIDILPPSLKHGDAAVARIELDGVLYHCKHWSPPVASLKSAVFSDNKKAGFIELGYTKLVHTRDQEASFLSEEKKMLEAVSSHVSRMLDNRHMAIKLTQSERLKAIGQLTGGVAHDFNNLLTVILGNAELLSERLSSDDDLHSLAKMTKLAAEKAAELTHRLLAFARQQSLAPEITDIHTLIEGMESLIRRTLGENINIEIKSDPDLWVALIDPSQLESAVLNLCINARDAMPEGGRLTIELSNVELDDVVTAWSEEVAPGEYIQLTVSDTGTGMPPDIAKRAFEPFFTTKDPGKGSGLGLSMVYGFTRQSSGHAQLYSEPGIGSCIKLYLPRGQHVEPALPAIDAAQNSTSGGEKILLVEDDDLVRSHATNLLKIMGYQVVSASNGVEALSILMQGNTFDLLFTDIVMPGGLDGRQLAVEAQKLYPDLPILFTSGYTDAALLHDGSLKPGFQLLNKPYKKQTLAEKIRLALSERTA